MLQRLLALGALSATAAADGASIIAAMTKISSATADLNTTVASWSGDILGSLPIIAKSAVLLVNIKSGAHTAAKSDDLNATEAINVAVATQTLSTGVNQTLESIMAARPKFNKLLISPITLLNLDLQKDATQEFSDDVISKVPEELQSTAEALVKVIEDSFDQAIEYYKGQL